MKVNTASIMIIVFILTLSFITKVRNEQTIYELKKGLTECRGKNVR